MPPRRAKIAEFLLLALMPLLAPVKSKAAPLAKLANGLRYVVVEDHASPVVSMQIWVRCGGVNEDDESAGVSHFLEHMLFKGTERLTAGEIARVVEKRGGSINAATGAETTHYYIDVPSEHFAEAFQVLADSVLNPSFPPQELEKERLVILEEIKRRNDNPQSDLWDTFLETIYRHTAYRRQVIGSAEKIRAMPRETLIRQHKLFYVPGNMVVVVVGDVKASDARRRIKQAFGGLPKSEPPPFPPLIEPRADRGVVRSITRPAQQAHVALGFVGPSLDDPRQVAMDVLATVLGGGNSSRLYQTLREQKRSVWNVGSSFITHHGSGVLGIWAECPPEKARSLPNDLYLLLLDADSNGFKPDELARAKAQLRSSWLFSQETYHGQASQWGFYTVLDRPGMINDYVKMLNRVTLADLKDLLRFYFGGRQLSGVILKPAAASGSGDPGADREP
jgi:zinc protease